VATGNVKGPLGPLMLLLLLGIAGFMLYVVLSPELAEQFERPAGFYENTFGKIGIALLFAVAVSAVAAIVRRLTK
jgi:hypothetical protein